MSSSGIRALSRLMDPDPALATMEARLLEISVSEIVAFIALVEYGGFTATARQLHLSQPGVSARIRRLEKSLGTVLVDRSVRRLTLTPQGAAFLPFARQMLAALQHGAQMATRQQMRSPAR